MVEPCPKCGEVNILVSKDMKATRHCTRCGYQWEPSTRMPNLFDQNHPCRDTCSGWWNGHEKGRDSMRAEREKRKLPWMEMFERERGVKLELMVMLQAERDQLAKVIGRLIETNNRILDDGDRLSTTRRLNEKLLEGFARASRE